MATKPKATKKTKKKPKPKPKPKPKASPKPKPKSKTKVASVAAKKKRPKKGEKGYRAPKKTFSLSILDTVYLAYVIRLMTGKSIRAILEGFLDGSIKEEMIALAFSVLERFEADGISIAVEASVVLLVKKWFKKAVGGNTILKLGPLRIKP